MVKSTPILLALAALVSAEPPIPSKPYGVPYNYGSADAPVQIDFFLDLLCPDSRNAYPNVVKLADTYPEQIRVLFHHFPLPYHRNAFIVHQAAQVFLNITDDEASFATWADTVFKNQAIFNGTATIEVVSANIKKLAAEKFPDVNPNDIDQGLQTRARNLEVRWDFKYGGTRGVYGTPAIFINGIQSDFQDDVTYERLYSRVSPILN